MVFLVFFISFLFPFFYFFYFLFSFYVEGGGLVNLGIIILFGFELRLLSINLWDCLLSIN